MLFDIKKINAAQDRAVLTLKENPSVSDKESAKREMVRARRCFFAHQFVDLGQSVADEELSPLLVDRNVRCVGNFIADPFFDHEARPAEMALAPLNINQMGEAALLIAYQSMFGAVACVYGLRNPTFGIYAARDLSPIGKRKSSWARETGHEILFYRLCPPRRLAEHDVTFRAIPVRIPSMPLAHAELIARVKRFLFKTGLDCGGRELLWGEPGFERIFALAAQNWWRF